MSPTKSHRKRAPRAMRASAAAARVHSRRPTDVSLKGAFIERASAAIATVATRLEAAELKQAVSAPTQAGTILFALPPPRVGGLFTPEDPLAKARLRGIERRDQLLAQEGGTLSSEQVSRRLRITRQAVDQRRKNGGLLAIDVGRRGYLYPAWQFDEGGVISGLPRVLALLRAQPPLPHAR